MIQDLKKESDKMNQYREMVMSRPFDLDDTTGPMILRIKFALSKILCLGSDAKISSAMLVPALFLLIQVDVWMESHLKINVHCITDPLYTAYAAVVNLIACSVTYYWGLWIVHYLKHDTDYHITVKKMTRNILVPLDMTGFYRVMVWGNDPTTEFVREVVKSLQFYDEYRERQIRNGHTLQF
jgi:hypothetical protein